MIIDFVHDIVCPWSRIGLANLRAALAQKPDEPVTIHFRPFQLMPDLPAEGMDYLTYISSVAVTSDTDIETVAARIRAAGTVAGLTFNLQKVQRMPNSLPAHVLAAAAGDEARPKVIDALHKAYWEDGRDIGDQRVLLAIAGECGLDQRSMQGALEHPEFGKMVGNLALQMRRDGVETVPFFVINESLAVSGAYEPAQLRDAMNRAAANAATRGSANA
jgi:predicted DsbA family dithiol-disulfide isomerase